jgi:hypothetical protein
VQPNQSLTSYRQSVNDQGKEDPQLHRDLVRCHDLVALPRCNRGSQRECCKQRAAPNHQRPTGAH